MENSYLNLVLFSEKRKNILLLLKEGPKSLEELRNSLNASPTSVQPQIKMLKGRDILCGTRKKYELTLLGNIIAENMQNLVNTMETLEDKYDFWANHKLDGIPLYLLKRIGELKQSTFTKPLDESSMFSPHTEFVENIAKSKFVKGISPFIHPLYPKMFLQFAEKGIDVSLVVTEAVLGRMKTEFMPEMEKFLAFENTRLFVYDKELQLSSAVTDGFLSLGLFYNSGAYDHINDIICFDPEALRWGEDLYAYYEGLSREVKEI
ncbi:hypothetical protein MSSIT_2608 [Methanosarcina siciliae T4/M]|uniref:Uncharacterized protein n=1 Tax=Methanosarcina siciliae T4/M TaxID=1434120 RepID=A0A0E3P6B7_9EURY|nr:winged helix-turn-helix domain-containing protein [Methanosarcina siciliae]AKB29327.1 hypothetical protein MSSIT_2608 [Methanosarcina siciliae T4/M]